MAAARVRASELIRVPAPRSLPSAALVGMLVLASGGCGRAPETAEPLAERLQATRVFLDLMRQAPLTADLRRRLSEGPHAAFRFVNRAWIETVCSAFEDEISRVPAVRLHGDAHVEQYAISAEARGLDDFDDSATGPALVDLVRFLGSVEIIAHQRGWDAARDDVAGAFLDGYRRGLGDVSYLPPDPAVVTRLRSRGSRSPAEFLGWAESLMRPLPAEDQARFDAGWPSFEDYAFQSNPELTAARLRLKRVGWLQLGIGSALNRKLLIRVEGLTAAPDDDVILEAKELLTLDGISCLTVPKSGELFRVVEGVTQVGRLHHRVLVVVPIFRNDRPHARGWWVKDWDPSYQELEIADLDSPADLKEIAYDVGVQLGSTNLRDISHELAPQKRHMEAETLTRLEPRMRDLAASLARATESAWETFFRER